MCTLCFCPNLLHFLTFVLLFPFFALLPLTKFYQVARSSIFSYTAIFLCISALSFRLPLLPRISVLSTIFSHLIMSSPYAVLLYLQYLHIYPIEDVPSSLLFQVSLIRTATFYNRKIKDDLSLHLLHFL